jgi:hypothetical protein
MHILNPFLIGKLSDEWLPIWTELYVSFKHILNNVTNFMGTSNSIRTLCNNSYLTKA